jgi:hypothetical protein
MRYLVAILALLAGVTATAPAAMAEGQNGGGGCHHNGVVSSCVRPAPVYLGNGSGSGTFAGPEAAQATPPAVPGYDTGYNTVVQPSQPALRVQFPL